MGVRRVVLRIDRVVMRGMQIADERAFAAILRDEIDIALKQSEPAARGPAPLSVTLELASRIAKVIRK